MECKSADINATPWSIQATRETCGDWQKRDTKLLQRVRSWVRPDVQLLASAVKVLSRVRSNVDGVL